LTIRAIGPREHRSIEFFCNMAARPEPRIHAPPAADFLDLETTGMLAAEERITEIGLIEVANGAFVDSWSSW